MLVIAAAGTLGRATARALIRQGHQVVGATTRRERMGEIEALGAEPVLANVLDPDSLVRALRAQAPEAVIALLSARPRSGLTRLREFGPTLELWERGSEHLLAASARAGVQRIVAESVIFAYGYGDQGATPLEERDPPIDGAVLRGHRAVLRALRGMERRTTQAERTHGVEGLVQRTGILYGAAVPSTERLISSLRQGQLRLPGRAGPELSWVESADAARARVAALERGASGETYNVADSSPRSFLDFARSLSRSFETPPPKTVPWPLARLLRPHAAVYAGATGLIVSSDKARRELRWEPRHASVEAWLEALPTPRAPGV